MASHDVIEELRDRITYLEDCLRSLTTPDADEVCGVRLAPQPARILGALTKAKGRALNRDSLMYAACWDRLDDWPDPKMIDVHVCTIRKALREARAPVSIQTVWGLGYKAVPLRAGKAARC